MHRLVPFTARGATPLHIPIGRSAHWPAWTQTGVSVARLPDAALLQPLVDHPVQSAADAVQVQTFR
jgi:hypothetical protein